MWRCWSIVWRKKTRLPLETKPCFCSGAFPINKLLSNVDKWSPETSGKKQLRAPQTKWTTLIGARPGSEYKKHQRRFVRPRLRTAMRRYKLAEAFFKRTFFFLVARAVCDCGYGQIRHPDGQRRRRRRRRRTRRTRGREREREREK